MTAKIPPPAKRPPPTPPPPSGARLPDSPVQDSGDTPTKVSVWNPECRRLHTHGPHKYYKRPTYCDALCWGAGKKRKEPR